MPASLPGCAVDGNGEAIQKPAKAYKNRFFVKSYFEYLPSPAPSLAWGLSVTAGGYTHIPPRARYPFLTHPRPYHFTWEAGRTLETYQLIFLSKGKGRFESRLTGLQTLKAGDVVILFPGVWHRYSPDEDTGWDEHWIEIHGPVLEQWRAGLPNFTPEQAIVPSPASAELLNLYRMLHRILKHKARGYQAYLAGLGAALFALALGNPAESTAGSEMEQAVRKAQQQLSGAPGTPFKLRDFLREFSLSEAHFRKNFKRSTGLTVKEYQQSIRLAHAQNLLLHSRQTIKEIAAALGFSSPFHFSSFFSRHKGVPPTRFRPDSTKA